MDVKQIDAIIKVLSEFRKEYIAMRDENYRLKKRLEQISELLEVHKKDDKMIGVKPDGKEKGQRRKRGPKLTAYKFVKLVKSTGKFTAVVKRKGCRFSKYGFETAEAAHLAALDAIAAAGKGNGVSPVTPDEIEEAKIKGLGEPVVFHQCKKCGYTDEAWKTAYPINGHPERCPKCDSFKFEKITQRKKLLDHTMN